jgi:hypothetical protein
MGNYDCKKCRDVGQHGYWCADCSGSGVDLAVLPASPNEARRVYAAKQACAVTLSKGEVAALVWDAHADNGAGRWVAPWPDEVEGIVAAAFVAEREERLKLARDVEVVRADVADALARCDAAAADVARAGRVAKAERRLRRAEAVLKQAIWENDVAGGEHDECAARAEVRAAIEALKALGVDPDGDELDESARRVADELHFVCDEEALEAVCGQDVRPPDVQCSLYNGRGRWLITCPRCRAWLDARKVTDGAALLPLPEEVGERMAGEGRFIGASVAGTAWTAIRADRATVAALCDARAAGMQREAEEHDRASVAAMQHDDADAAATHVRHAERLGGRAEEALAIAALLRRRGT